MPSFDIRHSYAFIHYMAVIHTLSVQTLCKYDEEGLKGK